MNDTQVILDQLGLPDTSFAPNPWAMERARREWEEQEKEAEREGQSDDNR